MNHPSDIDHESLERQIVGCILGTALGDAIGLPYEGLSPRRAARLLGAPDRHRFFFGRGMVSDDTEHTCLVAQSLIESGGDPVRFQNALARRFRFWLMGIPAGIGWATLRAIVRLWFGVSPDRSGVFSAGNGPAMRAAILGASIANPLMLRQYVRASTRLTHRDPKAEMGALVVALAAQMAAQRMEVSAARFLAHASEQLNDAFDQESNEFTQLITDAVRSVSAGQSTEAFADSLGLVSGVTGYVYHTVPVALHAWLSFPCDFRSAVSSVIRCGGDADTTAAIVGGIVGTSVGRSGLPQDWLSRLMEWPRTASWMEQLGTQVASIDASKTQPRRLPVLGLAVRNLFFVAVVLFHGIRRLLPPY